MDINNLNEARSLVIEFKDSEFLNGNIKNLENFSFWNFFDIASDFKIKESAKIFVGNYDSPNKFDGDRLPITYAIDKLLYADKGIKNFEGNIGKIYTGDTINTFNTLFGNRFYYNEQTYKIENRQQIVQERYNFSEELIKKRDMFFISVYGDILRPKSFTLKNKVSVLDSVGTQIFDFAVAGFLHSERLVLLVEGKRIGIVP